MNGTPRDRLRRRPGIWEKTGPFQPKETEQMRGRRQHGVQAGAAHEVVQAAALP
ncbi:MAG: hypothetical protein ACYCXN_01595 [Acidimicrobiales bacterium]